MADKNRDFKLIGLESISWQGRVEKPAISVWQARWRRFKKNRPALVSLWFLALLLFFSLGSALFLSPENANAFNTKEVAIYRNLPPKASDRLPFWNGRINYPESTAVTDVYDKQEVPKGRRFILGTDSMGRSMAKRVVVGIRISLLIALVVSMIDLVIGVSYGLISGYMGGKLDTVMQRIIEVISSVPDLIIVTMLGLLFGRGLASIIASIAIVGWTSMARQVRNLTLSYRERDFVLAARSLGKGGVNISVKHILPHVLGVVIVQMVMTVPTVILYETVLSAVNLGLKSPTASLGTLITDAQENLQYYPYQVITPVLALILISLAFVLLGDGLRDVFDKKIGDC